jgi:hypothetical protein
MFFIFVSEVPSVFMKRITFQSQRVVPAQASRHVFLFMLWLISAVAIVMLILAAPARAAQPAETSPFALEIPFDSDHGVPIVKVWVNGKGPFAFIVDTGEEHMGVISPKIANELKLPQVGTGKTSDPTNGHEVDGPMFETATLEFAGFKSEKVQLFGIDAGVDGVIGLPMFREYLSEFQPANKRIVLRRASLPESNGKDIFTYTAPEGIPDMEMSIAGRPVRVHPDSGNPGTISLPKKLGAGLDWVAPPVKVGEAGTIANKFDIFEGQVKTDLRLGQFVFPHPYLVVNDFSGTHANFGFGLFKLFRSVSFDQQHLRVRFESDKNTIQIESLFQ